MAHVPAALCLLLLLVPFPARAVLQSIDLAAPGDGLVTRDTETGLDWLDVTQTLDLSYDDVQAGAGGFVASG